jgi:TonB family protein
LLESVLWVSLLAATGAVDLETALKKPLSPASLALLLGHAGRPEAWDRWRDGLNDAKPENRAAAARMIFLAKARTLAPDVENALAQETDVAAADEEAQALLSLQGAAAVEPVLAASGRLPSMSAPALLGRAMGPGALSLFPDRLRVSGDAPVNWEDFFRRTTRAGTEGFSVATAKALRAGASPWWGLLRMAREARVDVDSLVLLEAARSAVPAVRAATCWHLAIVASGGKRPDPELQAAALAPLASPIEESAPENDPLRATVACEVLGRVVGREKQDLSGPLSRGGGWDPFAYEALRRGLDTHLTKAERKPLGLDPEPAVFSKDSWRARAQAERQSAIRTVSGHPPGFVRDVISLTGCELKTGEGWYAADVRRDPQGRPVSVQSSPSQSLAGPCAEAGQLLLATDVGEPGVASEVLLAMLEPDPIACLTEPDPPRRPEGTVGTRILAPKKVRNVAPIYPEVARQSRRQGVVVLEAVISPTGCIRRLELVQWTDTGPLNAAAIRAVSQWRYTPTLLNGRPVPVIMTITVNFRLS